MSRSTEGKRDRASYSVTRGCLAALLVLTCIAFTPRAATVASGDASANPFARDANRDPGVLNVAHGGASLVAPQNTIPAGEIAFELGANVWGVDVRRTSDGAFVLMHDATLDRTTDIEQVFPNRAPWRVDAFTLEEIERLDAGSWFVDEDPFGEIAAGNVVDAARYAGVPVPTLRQALDLIVAVDRLIDIEVKDPGAADRREIATALAALILDTRAEERVLVSSFDHEFLRELRAVAPEIPIGALSVFAPLGGADELADLGADVYLPSLVGWTPDLVAELASRGIGVIPWTYNDPAQLQRLASTPGITGIYTDDPQRLTKILHEGEVK